MGLFGGLKNLVFGGGASTGYVSPYTKEYDSGARTALMNRLGATKNGNTYDFSNVGKQITAGDQGYDFSNLDAAISSLKSPSSYSPKNYTAAKFDFASLPDQYYNSLYESGASDVRRENAGQLDKLRETIGPQRAGLLLKASQNSQRDTLENLAKMRAGLSQEQMREKTDLGTKQQLAQAEENFKAAGFNDEQARYKAQDLLSRSQALSSASQGKLGLQQSATQNERAYQDQSLQYLMDMLYKNASLSGQAADRKNQVRGQEMSFLGDAAKGIGAAYGYGR